MHEFDCMLIGFESISRRIFNICAAVQYCMIKLQFAVSKLYPIMLFSSSIDHMIIDIMYMYLFIVIWPIVPSKAQLCHVYFSDSMTFASWAQGVDTHSSLVTASIVKIGIWLQWCCDWTDDIIHDSPGGFDAVTPAWFVPTQETQTIDQCTIPVYCLTLYNSTKQQIFPLLMSLNNSASCHQQPHACIAPIDATY